MATRFIDKEFGANSSTAIANDATGTRKVANLPDAAGFVYDSVDNQFKFNAAGTIKFLADSTTTQTLTNKTLTSPTITGATVTGPAPVSETTASRTLGVLDVGRWTVADRAAGVAFTLPAATGTGSEFKVVLGTALTSGSVTVAAAGTDTFTGYAIVEDTGDTAATDATIFATVNGTTDTWTSAFTGGGGEIGDHIIATDFKSGTWLVRAWGQAVLDSTATPFSGS